MSGPQEKHWAERAATVFGLGYLKPASGTWASAAAIPPGWLLIQVGGLPVLFGAIAVVFLLGCWVSSQYEKISGRHDTSEIVIDEVAGQWITLMPLAVLPDPPLWGYLLGFALFRLFDITKPWPIYIFDRKLVSGFGVMADDALAGVYGAIVFFITIDLGFW